MVYWLQCGVFFCASLLFWTSAVLNSVLSRFIYPDYLQCALANQPTFASLLLRMGVNPNMSTAENPTRPHLLAAYRGHHQVLRWGVNPNMSTAENPTRPHLLAAYRGHHQVLRWGVNPNMSTAENPSRPHLRAAYRGHHQVLRMGDNPNISTTENPTWPHLLAAYRGHHQVLRWGLIQTSPSLRIPPCMAPSTGHLQGPLGT